MLLLSGGGVDCVGCPGVFVGSDGDSEWIVLGGFRSGYIVSRDERHSIESPVSIRVNSILSMDVEVNVGRIWKVNGHELGSSPDLEVLIEDCYHT